jgi:phage-related protein (TIGR01555 family)
MANKRTVLRAAKREANRPIPPKPRPKVNTTDSFQNFASNIGLGTDNQSTAGTYGFNPITRIRLILEWAYRGSWICRMAVRTVADDMTKQGVTLGSDMDPQDRDLLQTAFSKKFMIFGKLAETIGWGRLYGGAGAVMLLDGHDLSKPLDVSRVSPGQFCGLLPLDRWMVDPSLNDLVTDLRSPDLGKPKYYTVVADAPAAPRQKIHHTRFLRFEGDDLPYYQRLSENLWGLSVLESVFDRILAFDSSTQGAAQLVYRAHIRNLSISGLREIIGTGGKMLDALIEQIEWMRRWQGNEGVTILDSEDRFESLQYTFAGLDTVLIQMGQQISGALQIPLVRLFGQSPAGLNSTGESDMRMYYDGILSQQERHLRPPLEVLIRVIAQSEGVKIPDNFNFEFVPLWQLAPEQKAAISAQTTQSVLQAFEAGVVTHAHALKELRNSSVETGIWGNITDEDIEEAENEPKVPPGMGMPGMEGTQPGEPGQGQPGQPGEEPPPPDFLPGSDDAFLPNSGSPFLPNSGSPKPDSGGAFVQSELEKADKKQNQNFHIHIDDPYVEPEGGTKGHLHVEGEYQEPEDVRKQVVRLHTHDRKKG